MRRTITALTPQKRNPRRVNLYLDGEFVLGLSSILASRLRVGEEIDTQELHALEAAEIQEKAYQRALNYLSYRPRSRAEVQGNLTKHAIPEDVIKQVIDRLQENNLVDDLKFAQAWVENRSDFRPRSRWVLAMELHQKGIHDDIIEQALAGIDEEQLAFQAARKQSRKYRGLEWHDFRRKLSAFLARRGFKYEIIKPIVDRIWADNQAETLSEDCI
jgi:regulatory protein